MARARGLGSFGRQRIAEGLTDTDIDQSNTPAAQPSPRTEEDAAASTYRRAGISAPDPEGYVWIDPSATQWPLAVKGNPPGPRTQKVAYSLTDHRVRMVFRDGATYAYEDVSPQEWERIRRTASTGKFVNRVLNSHPYSRENFSYPS